MLLGLITFIFSQSAMAGWSPTVIFEGGSYQYSTNPNQVPAYSKTLKIDIKDSFDCFVDCLKIQDLNLRQQVCRGMELSFRGKTDSKLECKAEIAQDPSQPAIQLPMLATQKSRTTFISYRSLENRTVVLQGTAEIQQTEDGFHFVRGSGNLNWNGQQVQVNDYYNSGDLRRTVSLTATKFGSFTGVESFFTPDEVDPYYSTTQTYLRQ